MGYCPASRPGVFWEKINSQPSLAGDAVPQEVHDVLRVICPSRA